LACAGYLDATAERWHRIDPRVLKIRVVAVPVAVLIDLNPLRVASNKEAIIGRRSVRVYAEGTENKRGNLKPRENGSEPRMKFYVVSALT
jgi:hypothetical protein